MVDRTLLKRNAGKKVLRLLFIMLHVICFVILIARKLTIQDRNVTVLVYAFNFLEVL